MESGDESHMEEKKKNSLLHSNFANLSNAYSDIKFEIQSEIGSLFLLSDSPPETPIPALHSRHSRYVNKTESSDAIRYYSTIAEAWLARNKALL